jgi:hypothetical protein
MLLGLHYLFPIFTPGGFMVKFRAGAGTGQGERERQREGEGPGRGEGQGPGRGGRGRGDVRWVRSSRLTTKGAYSRKIAAVVKR